ncbi:MAG: hypothetical protein GC191_06855 [Azospirillum sp.]|nr:hypothetical protein [Azospirillum sp.]
MTRESGFEEAPAEPGAATNQSQDSAIRILANCVHRLNEAVVKCVNAGVSVELMRTARYHDASGNWGDQVTPIISRGK